MATALIVGGTAATGPAIVAELMRREYEVTIYHRGVHELAELSDFEHIHGEPHFIESIEHDLAGRTWDVTIATYGRIRYLADVLRGRTEQFIAVSGSPILKDLPGLPRYEYDPYKDPGESAGAATRLLGRMIETERGILDRHEAGDYVATIVRYPYVYGPHGIRPFEWHVIQRVLDHRKRWVLEGNGLMLWTRCAAPNAARMIALAVDRPSIAGGQIYHAADDRQFSFKDWVQMVARFMDYEFEFVDVSSSIVSRGYSAVPQSYGNNPDHHHLLSNIKAKIDLTYEDAVRPEDWLSETVDYWLANRPTVDGVGNHLKPEEFDYDAEDRLLAWWDGVRFSAPADLGVAIQRRHAYPHPAKPGDVL